MLNRFSESNDIEPQKAVAPPWYNMNDANIMTTFKS